MTQQIDHNGSLDGTISLHQGMNDHDASWLLQPTQAALIQDMQIDRQGQWSKRYGMTTIGAASGATDVRPGALMPFWDSALTQDVLYSIQDGQAIAFPGNGSYFQIATGASFTRTQHMGSRGYAGGRDTLFMHSAEINFSSPSLASLLVGVNIDRTDTTATGMAPTCSAWWQYRLWCGNNMVLGDDQSVWWSSINDGLTYSAINSIRVEPGRGGRIMGFAPVRSVAEAAPQMLVFKERMIAILTTYWGSSSSLIPGAGDALDTIKSSVRPFADTYGCVATKSIQYVTGSPFGDIVFLAHDGIRAIRRAENDTLAGASKPISQPIRATIGRVNFTHAQKAVSVVWDQKYFLAVPLDGSTENTHVLILDLNDGAWYLNSWKAGDLATDRLTTTSDKIWIQDNRLTADSTASGLTTGFHVYRGYNGYVDPNGVPPTFQWDSRDYAFQDITRKKRWEWVGITGQVENGSSPQDMWGRVDRGEWQQLASFTLPDESQSIVIMGSDPLPWVESDSSLHMRKADLSTLPPGYTLQVRVSETAASSYARPTFFRMNVAARIIDPEFDNKIT